MVIVRGVAWRGGWWWQGSVWRCLWNDNGDGVTLSGTCHLPHRAAFRLLIYLWCQWHNNTSFETKDIYYQYLRQMEKKRISKASEERVSEEIWCDVIYPLSRERAWCCRSEKNRIDAQTRLRNRKEEFALHAILCILVPAKYNGFLAPCLT
jgi:hypothetical protein